MREQSTFGEFPKKVLVATPMYGGVCYGGYLQSLSALASVAFKFNIEVSHIFVQNESLITRARNFLAHEFLKSDADFLLFIDADHRFHPEDILKMVLCDMDVLCAIPPKKHLNLQSMIQAGANGANEPEFFSGDFVVGIDPEQVSEISVNEPFEIVHGGTGIMLIKRKVFEALKEHRPWYIPNNTSRDLLSNEKVFEFFFTEIVDNILLSEDYAFCRAWRNLGGKIYAAPWVRVTHIGTYEFRGSFVAHLQMGEVASK